MRPVTPANCADCAGVKIAACRVCGRCPRHCACWGGEDEPFAGTSHGRAEIRVVVVPGPNRRRVAILCDSRTTKVDIKAAVPAANEWAAALEAQDGEPPAELTRAEIMFVRVVQLLQHCREEDPQAGPHAVAHLLNRLVDDCIAELAGVTVDPKWRSTPSPKPPTAGLLGVRWTVLKLNPRSTAEFIISELGPSVIAERAIDDAVARAKAGKAPFESGPTDGERIDDRLRKRTSQPVEWHPPPAGRFRLAADD